MIPAIELTDNTISDLLFNELQTVAIFQTFRSHKLIGRHLSCKKFMIKYIDKAFWDHLIHLTEGNRPVYIMVFAHSIDQYLSTIVYIAKYYRVKLIWMGPYENLSEQELKLMQLSKQKISELKRTINTYRMIHLKGDLFSFQYSELIDIRDFDRYEKSIAKIISIDYFYKNWEYLTPVFLRKEKMLAIDFEGQTDQTLGLQEFVNGIEFMVIKALNQLKTIEEDELINIFESLPTHKPIDHTMKDILLFGIESTSGLRRIQKYLQASVKVVSRSKDGRNTVIKINRSLNSKHKSIQRHIIIKKEDNLICDCELALLAGTCDGILIWIIGSDLEDKTKLHLIRKFGVIPGLISQSVVTKTSRATKRSSNQTIKYELSQKGRFFCQYSLSPYQYQIIDDIFNNWKGRDDINDFYQVVTSHLNYKSLKRLISWRDVIKERIRKEEYFDLRRLLNIMASFLHRYGFSDSYYNLKVSMKELSDQQIENYPELINIL
jgi:hypothetical protein